MLRPSVPRPEPDPQEETASKHMKYVDEATLTVSVDLKNLFKIEIINRPKPLNFNEKSELYLPIEHNLLQKQMQQFEDFTLTNKMKINQGKSKLILFNFSQ